MATDYDAPRKTVDDLSEDSLEELKTSSLNKAKAAATIDIDEADAAENELPGADLSGEELSIQVLPKQADEFTCTSCFLVHHRSQLSDAIQGKPVCKDCATKMNRKASKV